MNNARICPVCDERSLKRQRGTFRFRFPEGFPVPEATFPASAWDECEACGERILSRELEAGIEKERYRLQGLLSPAEIRAARERLGLSQTQMARLLGVGDKTYTRWESGRSIQTKSMDNLIRLSDSHPEVLRQLESERDPERLDLVEEYFRQLAEFKSEPELAVAAYGGMDESVDLESLRRRLKAILKKRTRGT